ncbi:MAG: MFS transporter [Planctomycetes bacterium]|nr:MFS transporter [Planctomycetota bacterium]
MQRDVVDRVDRPGAAAWVLYDTGNSIYSASVTFLLAPWLVDHLGASRTAFGATQTASMVVAGLMVPVLGALCDRTRWTRPLLIAATLIAVGAMAAMTLPSTATQVLAWFALANVAYQAALVFYDALLPSITPLRRAGLVSGLGVGLGFAGTILTAGSLALFGAGLHAPHAMRVGAIAFLALTLPCLVAVRDRRRIERRASAATLAGDALRDVLATLRGLPRHRPLLLFLLGNFFLTDVIWTAALFFADYTTTVFHEMFVASGLDVFGLRFEPTPGQEPKLTAFLGTLGAALNVGALLFGIALGALADRWSALGTMRIAGVVLGLALVGGVAFGGIHAGWFAATMVFGGAFGMAGVKTAGRKVLLELAPRERLAEHIGLYGITTKLSVLGAVSYGAIADVAGVKPALLAQCVQIAIGLACLWAIRMPEPAATPSR